MGVCVWVCGCVGVGVSVHDGNSMDNYFFQPKLNVTTHGCVKHNDYFSPEFRAWKRALSGPHKSASYFSS